MKKRGKVLLSVAVCALCLCLLITGVYASSTIVTFEATSTLNFSPSGAYAGIKIQMYQGKLADETAGTAESFTQLEGTEYTLSQLKNFTPDETTSGFPLPTESPKDYFISGTEIVNSWTAGEVILYLAKPTVRYKVTIYNYSSYAIEFIPSYEFTTTSTEQAGNGDQLVVTASTVSGDTTTAYTFAGTGTANTAVEISAATDTTPTSVTFVFDVTVKNNDYAIDTSLTLSFDIQKQEA